MSSSRFEVVKFGGTSVGSPGRLQQVLELVRAHAKRTRLVVVVSAMGETTDWLLSAIESATAGDLQQARSSVERVAGLARSNATAVAPSRSLELSRKIDDLVAPLHRLVEGVSLVRECSGLTKDRILSFGELLSATLIPELLAGVDVEAGFCDARDLLVSDDRFGAARVDPTSSLERIRAASSRWNGSVPVVPGFIAATLDGRTTTLGRNGSDYTAALLAQGLEAAEMTVWTDVLGLHTADPAIVPDAYPVARLTHAEALELASVGARMFHPRTMIPLIEAGIPLRICNTMTPEHPGTLVDATGSQDELRPSCVATREDLALVGIEVRRLSDQFHLGERCLAALRETQVSVWLTAQPSNGQSIALVIPRADLARAQTALESELSRELERREVEPLVVRHPVTLLSLVAEAMGDSVGVAGRLFGALGAVGVNIRAIAQGASSRSISCVVDAVDTNTAVRTTHAAFNLAHQEVNLFVLGRGTVGSQLLQQIRAQRAQLQAQHGITLRITGIADSRRVAFDPAGLDISDLEGALVRSEGTPRADAALSSALDQLGRLPVPILVDCTAANGMEATYLEGFKRGIHVVAANKKPLTLPWEARESLFTQARRHHVAYHYETTVASSLPVIDTLASLVRTGDVVERIVASLSGTLGYLCNEVMAGVPLSRAVRAAMAAGFTEPDPREDLGGVDVARKAVILARELGLSLALSDVALEPFVSLDSPPDESVDAFLRRLEGQDESFEKRVAGYRRAGSIRYLARIEPSRAGSTTPVIRVGPTVVEPGQAGADLRGSESVVSFQTLRHHDYPLTVRGAGAGGAVTASGVLADILRISQTLRGR